MDGGLYTSKFSESVAQMHALANPVYYYYILVPGPLTRFAPSLCQKIQGMYVRLCTEFRSQLTSSMRYACDLHILT